MLDKTFRRTQQFVGITILLMLLSACSSTVVVKGDIPKPLIEKLPLKAKISYSEKFQKYTYTESEKKRALTSLDFGSAQVTMFDQIFSTLLTLLPSGSTEASVTPDVIIEPEILDLQYTAPRETSLNLYEVWLKYRLRISDAQNQEIADWTVKGYGKTPTATLTSAAGAFNAATNVALRDVGAQLSLGFGKQPSIKALIDSAENGAVLVADDQPDSVNEAGDAPVELNSDDKDPGIDNEVDDENQQ